MTHARQEKEELMGSPFSIPNDNFQDLESVGLRRLKTKHCSHETDELEDSCALCEFSCCLTEWCCAGNTQT